MEEQKSRCDGAGTFQLGPDLASWVQHVTLMGTENRDSPGQ